MKLKQVGAIKEVFYPEWLANTMVAKKKTRKWRVCIDFTNLNKACPKNPIPMPWIDQLMDATVGYHWMSFWMLPKATTRYPWLWMIKRGRLLLFLLGITITR